MKRQDWEIIFDAIFNEAIEDEAELLPIADYPTAQCLIERYNTLVEALQSIAKNSKDSYAYTSAISVLVDVGEL